MRTGKALGVGLLCVASSLACSGILQDTRTAPYEEMCVKLDLQVPATDQRRAMVHAVLDDAWLAAWEGRLGFFGTITFEGIFDEAVADGSIAEGEWVLLRDAAAPYAAAVPLDPTRQAELLAIKAVRVTRAVPVLGIDPALELDIDRPSSPIDGWVLPLDLQQALSAEGFEVSCTAATVAEAEAVRCEGRKDGVSAPVVSALVVVARYATPADADELAFYLDAPALRLTGRTALAVTVSANKEASEALAEALVTP